jgi:tetrahydromethanopterin S-methyltransferase subunit A
MLKVKPPDEYPPEPGRYVRGNDYSPVAVCAILDTFDFAIPQDLNELVLAATDSGAAIAGMLQTENIGMEKMVCNIIGNPNIRYLIVTGPESPGHSTGDAIIALFKNGIDGRRRIVGTHSPTPYLFNLPVEFIERFRKQIVDVVDLLNKGTPDLLRKAVWSCYQEKPVQFETHTLYDTGAYPEAPISARITWRVTNPVSEPKDEEERRQKESFLSRMEQIRMKVEGKKSQRKDG